VQESVYDKFIALLVSRANELVVGNGMEEKTVGGPLVSKVQYDKVWNYIESGKAEGAKVILGGEKRQGKGFYVDPTSEHFDSNKRTNFLIYFQSSPISDKT
jgi:aldehyde dehydrogenase (NAD+)